MPYYSYNNQDITIDILMKLEEVARILAGILKKPFDEVLGMIYSSKTFEALKIQKVACGQKVHSS